MRSYGLLVAIAASVAGAGAVACSGGGGPLPDGMTVWDPAGSSYEQAGSSSEPSPGFGEGASGSGDGVSVTNEPAPGAQGGGGPGGFDCSGEYRCVEEGDDDGDEIRLVSRDGVCSVRTDGEGSLVLAGDGTLLLNGNAIGVWQGSGGQFTATTAEGTIRCTKTASGSDDDSEREDRRPPSARD